MQVESQVDFVVNKTFLELHQKTVLQLEIVFYLWLFDSGFIFGPITAV